MRSSTKQKGFSLIELMIVIAIIGILAAIAVPAYGDYIARSQISEALAQAGFIKTTISEWRVTRGSLPTGTDLAAFGVPDPSAGANSKITGSAYTRTSDNEITFALCTSIESTNIYFSGNFNNGTFEWECQTQAQANFRYVPANCRNIAGTQPTCS